MSFWIYQFEAGRYRRDRPVRLTGADGVLARFLTADPDVPTPFSWRLDRKALIKGIDAALAPDCCELVMDMKPAGSAEICLYQISAIHGCSQYDETDLVLVCRVLIEEGERSRGGNRRDDFVAAGARNESLIYEPLRLSGGTAEGRFFWASPRMEIGATVCPGRPDHQLVMPP